MEAAIRFVTVVIRLPDDALQRHALLNAIHPHDTFKEGHVSAVYAGDAITENEILEQYVPPRERRRIRSYVNGLSQLMSFEA